MNRGFPRPGARPFGRLRRRCAGALLVFLLTLAGPAAAFSNCDDQPEQCCYGIYKGNSAVCNSRGTCYNQQCYCYSSFEGDQCESEKFCNSSTGEMISCGSNGVCQNGQCWCSGASGHGGFNCAVTVTPQLQPATLAFGAQAVGAASAPRGATLSSQFEAATVSSIDLGGANPGDFVLDGGCAAGIALAAQGSCELGVRFVPTAPGARSATLSIVTSVSGTPLTVALGGSGSVETRSLLPDPDPDTAGRLYAGLDGSGVHVSADGGASWTAAATQPGNPQVKALAKRSGTPLYAATLGGGVFKAADGTTAFAACATQPANLYVRSLALDAAGKLYAGTYNGMYVGSDGCASWTAINAGLP